MATSLVLIVVMGMMMSLYISEKKQIWAQIQAEQEEELAKLTRVSEESDFAENELIFFNYVKTLVLSDRKVAYAGTVDVYGAGWVYEREANKINLTDSQDPSVKEILSTRKLLRREVVSKKNERITELSKPVKNRGYVRLGYSRDQVDFIFKKSLSGTIHRFAIVGIIAFIFGLVLVRIFMTALAKPIDNLMKAARMIAKGEKGVQIPVVGKDELGRLTETFNSMSKELTKLDELKDDFMSHVSHELRSPLTSIIATVDLLAEHKQAKKDPKFRRSIDRLAYGSERLNKLVDNILDLTKMEAGKMVFDIQPTDMRTVLKEMADFFEPRALEKKLNIKADVSEGLPLVMADAEKIRQVLSNLIHNAIKFTNKGGITLRAKPEGSFVEVRVEDTGVGIPKDKISSIFEKFQCLSDTRDRVDQPVPGSGLGLNIVKNSIQSQGGKIWVESEIDKGSSFVFTLPLAKKSQVTAPTPAKLASLTPRQINN